MNPACCVPSGWQLAAIYAEEADAPTFFVGIETDGPDYEFQIDGLAVDEGGVFNLALDADTGSIRIDLEDTDSAGDYSLNLRRIDEEGESVFYTRALRSIRRVCSMWTMVPGRRARI